MLLLAGKIAKTDKVRNFFCLLDRRNSRHFFKIRAWRAAKTCACLLRSSALKREARRDQYFLNCERHASEKGSPGMPCSSHGRVKKVPPEIKR